jgi:hypothetical protein
VYSNEHEGIIATLQEICFNFIHFEVSNGSLSQAHSLPHMTLAAIQIPITFGQMPAKFQLRQPTLGKASSNHKNFD